MYTLQLTEVDFWALYNSTQHSYLPGTVLNTGVGEMAGIIRDTVLTNLTTHQKRVTMKQAIYENTDIMKYCATVET
jgi:hypothetical protein